MSCRSAFDIPTALLNPKTSVYLQKRPSYSGNLNSEMPGDSKNACLDVLLLRHPGCNKALLHTLASYSESDLQDCFCFAVPVFALQSPVMHSPIRF